MHKRGNSSLSVCLCVCVHVCVCVCASVCLCICYHERLYLVRPYKLKVRYHRILHELLKSFDVWISLKVFSLRHYLD